MRKISEEASMVKLANKKKLAKDTALQSRVTVLPDPSAPPKVLIYCRVSDTKQKTEGHGLDSQEHRCRQYCDAHGYEVEAVFPDDASGGGDFMNRPGMVALLHYLDQHRKTNYIVLFDDLKRFARDREFHFKLREALDMRGAKVECLNYRFDDSPEGEFMETIFAAQGQLERKQNKRQVIQKMRARLEQGYYVFAPPKGYTYGKVPGHGKILVRLEPLASIIAEAMEGFASGRFQMQAEVQRFFESQPDFPYKDSKGRVHATRVREILTCATYAGYVEKKEWGVSLRKGKHEALVSFEAFQRVQQRLTEDAKVPARKDIHTDFPLRGFVVCNDCGRPLTSCWSQGKTKKHPYYLCYYKDCESSKKSIPRHVLEQDFEALLAQLRPTQTLFDLAAAMFKDAWNQQAKNAGAMLQSARQKLVAIEKQIVQLVDRVVETSIPSAITRYEQRIAELEREKLLMEETMQKQALPPGQFEKLFELSMQFLANPLKLWHSGRLEHQRLVLKLAFEERISYCRKTGLRTPKTA
jgi:DNA invertase Pin-like site-specific DNA recombinase